MYYIQHISAYYGHHQVYQITKHFQEGTVTIVFLSPGIRPYFLEWKYHLKRKTSIIDIVNYIRRLHCAISVTSVPVEVHILSCFN
jgi:hypothetical protein